MILTAQRVRSLASRIDAIHAFYGVHGGPLPRTTTDPTVIDAHAARHSPTRLVRQRTKIHVGGNAVDSFLDVIAEDNVTPEALDRAIEGAKSSLTRTAAFFDSDDGRGTTYAAGGVVVLAWVSARISPLIRPIADEITALWDEGRALVVDPGHQDPLVILVREAADGIRMSLDNTSAGRVRRIIGPDWAPANIHISTDTRTAFEQVHGSIYDHLVASLTGLEDSVVQGLGGIRFVDATTGQTKYERLDEVTDADVWECYEEVLSEYPAFRRMLPKGYPRGTKFGITRDAMAKYSQDRTQALWHHMNLPLAIHSAIQPEPDAAGFGRSALKVLEDFSTKFANVPGAVGTLKPLWTHAWDLNDPEFWSVLSTAFLALTYTRNQNVVVGFARKIGTGTRDADISFRQPDGSMLHVDIEMWHKTSLAKLTLEGAKEVLRKRAIEKVDEKFSTLPEQESGIVAVVCTPRDEDFELLQQRPELCGLIQLQPERPRRYGYVYWIGRVTDGHQSWVDLRDRPLP